MSLSTFIFVFNVEIDFDFVRRTRDTNSIRRFVFSSLAVSRESEGFDFFPFRSLKSTHYIQVGEWTTKYLHNRIDRRFIDTDPPTEGDKTFYGSLW